MNTTLNSLREGIMTTADITAAPFIIPQVVRHKPTGDHCSPRIVWPRNMRDWQFDEEDPRHPNYVPF